MSRPTRKWRLNTRAAIILGAILGVGLPILVILSYYRGLTSPKTLLRQAEAQVKADPPQYELALSYLNEYLKTLSPDDPEAFEALDLKSDILDKTARSGNDLNEAARIGLQALRVGPRVPGIEPGGPKLQEIRRRLVRTYVKMVGFLGAEAPLSTAQDIAEEMVRLAEDPSSGGPGQASPEDLRLLADVIDVQAARSENETLRAEALDARKRAYEADPTNLEGAGRLAAVQQLRYNQELTSAKTADADPMAPEARRVLDHLLRSLQEAEAKADTPEAKAEAARQVAGAHMIRFRHLAALAGDTLVVTDRKKRNDLTNDARDEIERAIEKDPENADIRLAAAEFAATNGQIEEARKQLAAVPAEARDGLRGQIVRGLIDLSRNRPEEAIEAWRRGLEATGGSDADLTWRLAYVLIDLNRLDEAETLILQHRRLIGGDQPNPQHHFLQGLFLLKKNDPKKAIDELQKARFEIEERFQPQVLMALGDAYAKNGDANDAADMYAQAGKSRRNWAAPYLNRVAQLQQAGRFDDALVEIDLGLADMPENPELLVAKARALMVREQRKPADQRDWDEVETLLDKVRGIDPANSALVRAQADLKTVQGDLGAAAELLSAAVRRNPADAALWIAWATVLTRMNQPQQALIVLDQADEPDAAGDQAPIRVARARLQTALGNGQQARETLTRGIDDLPATDQGQLWAELGNQLRQRGETEEARQAYENWAKLQPGDPQAIVALLDLANIQGDRTAVAKYIDQLEELGGTGKVFAVGARAQELLRKVGGETPTTEELEEADRLISELEVDPNSQKTAHLLRGLYYERRNQPEEAISAYQRAVESGAGPAAATRLAVLYSESGRLDDLEQLRETMARGDLAAAAASGDSIGSFDRISTLALLRGGKPEEAEAIARQAVEADPRSLEARVWLARVLNTAGKPEEAEATLRELTAVSTEPGPWMALLLFQVQAKEIDAARATIDQIKQKVKTEAPELLWAQAYRMIGDNTAAEEAYQAALAKKPDDPNVVRALTTFYESTSQLAKGVALLRKTLEATPDARWAARALAMLLSQQPDNWDEAWSLAQLPANAKDAPEERLTRGLVLIRSSETAKQDDGIKLLEGLNVDLPTNNPVGRAARESLARIYLARNDMDKLAPLTATGALGSTNPQAIAVHAEVLLRDGKIAEARQQLQRLEELAPADVVTAKLRALLLKAEGKLAEAAAALERAFDEHRADPDGGRGAGRELVAMLGGMSADAGDRPPPIPDQYPVAERLARKLVETWPADAWMLGRILARQGKTDAALDACRTAADARDLDARAAREAASLAVSLAVAPDAPDARRDAADVVVERAREVAPNSTELMILQAYLRHAQQRYPEEVELYRAIRARGDAGTPLYLNNMAWTLALELNSPSEGLDIIDGLIASIAKDPRFAGQIVQCYDTRGAILVALDRPAEALRDFQAAVGADPKNPVYQYHLARAYLKAGQEDKFREHRELATKAGLKPELLEPSERAEMAELMAR